ncbi:hypothetical protein K525DRAFT_275756, partial [Schizophyllum commune Loenen D]
IDPTKKRTFSTSTLAPAASRKKNEPNLWTETPQERLQRLKDEVMGRTKGETEGRRKRAVNPTGDDGDDEEGAGDRERAKRRKVEEEHQRNVGEGVEEYTRKIRGPSLTEAHLERERQKAASKTKRDESASKAKRDESASKAKRDESASKAKRDESGEPSPPLFCSNHYPPSP